MAESEGEMKVFIRRIESSKCWAAFDEEGTMLGRWERNARYKNILAWARAFPGRI